MTAGPGRRATAALGLALAAVVVLLTSEPGEQRSPDGQPRTLSQAYPQLTTISSDGLLTDGTAYQPVFFIDPQRWVAVAPSDDGAWVRLLMRTGTTMRELRRLPAPEAAEFAGFVTDGFDLAWLELTSAADGAGHTRIWAMNLSADRPRLVTEDTGDVLLFDRKDDMVLHDGRLTWVAGTDGGQQVQVRTVGLTGGKVDVRIMDGPYALAGWPWMTSAAPQQEPVRLHNLATGESAMVQPLPGELLSCSATWCRAVIPGGDENSTKIELVRPDGAQRIRTASGAVAAALVDVAVLDRYEVYSDSGGSGTSGPGIGVRLLLYDLVTQQALLIASDVGQVRCRNRMLWWSTGDDEAPRWHWFSLADLAELS